MELYHSALECSIPIGRKALVNLYSIYSITAARIIRYRFYGNSYRDLYSGHYVNCFFF